MKTIKVLFLLSFFSNITFAQCYKAIKTNSTTTIALHNDGTLWAWGNNIFGVLGIGETSFSNFPNTQIGIGNNWSSKFSLKLHVLAIKTDGTLWAWGNNEIGQCGNNTSGTSNYINSPQQITTDLWSEVATGFNYSLAIKSDGTLWTWGRNDYGQLGNGTTNFASIPTQVGTDSNWAKVFSYSTTSYAIKSDGTLWSWGGGSGTLGRTNGFYTIPGQVGTSSNWLSLSPNSSSTMAIKTDGTLWAWGRNRSTAYPVFYGNGLNDTNNYENNPTQIGSDSNWKSISTDQYDFRALKTDGTLWGWGNNVNGILGDGTNIPRDTPIQFGLENDWVYLQTDSRAFAIKSNNSLYQWGDFQPVITYPMLSGTECLLSTSNFNKGHIVKLIPNPIHDKATLLFDEKIHIQEIIIYDFLGKTINRFEANSNKREMQIDFTPYSKGIYFIRIKSEKGYDILKISKD